VESPRGGDPNAASRGERFGPTRARALVSVYENIPSWDSSDVFPGGFASIFFFQLQAAFWGHRWRNSLISPDIP